MGVVSTERIRLSWDDLEEAVQALAYGLGPHRDRLAGIVAEPRGGLVLGVMLSHRLRLPLLDHPPPNVPVLWVDEIVDSGNTLCRAIARLNVVRSAAWVSRGVHADLNHAVYVHHGPEWFVFPWEPSDGGT
jgi:hypoxanthine phosphoribosyltransferase